MTQTQRAQSGEGSAYFAQEACHIEDTHLGLEVDKEAWSAEGFLKGLLSSAEPLVLGLSSALLRPMQEQMQDTQDPSDLACFLALGKKGSKKGIRDLLAKDESIIDSLAECIWDGLQVLCNSASATGSGLQAKFADDAKFELFFADLTKFFAGLEGMVGSPEANAVPAMEREHCLQQDSYMLFDTSNYGVRTSACVEWAFVYLNQPSPPIEMALHNGETVQLDHDGHWPREDPTKCFHPRTPLTPEGAKQMFDQVNRQLESLSSEEGVLLWAEFYAARLYTGPMFQKYNVVLRGGALNMQQPEKMVRDFRNLCVSNRYVTTIHAISSAVVKLGKRTEVGTVFRGFKDGRLPESFTKPNQDGICGGIECAFLSTTTDKSVATSYAGNGVATVLQMDMGMVDRGADLSDLSQYPDEAEVLFGPLTSLQVMETTVEGSILLVDVRPNINLTNTTMDRVLAKRRVLIESMCDGLLSQCHRCLSEEKGLWRPILDGEFFRLYEAFVHQRPEVRQAAKEAAEVSEQERGLILAAIRRQIPVSLRSVYRHPDELFTEDNFFKERVAEALDVKESIRLAHGSVLRSAANELEVGGSAEGVAAAQRARQMALALQEGEFIAAGVEVGFQEAEDLYFHKCDQSYDLWLRELGLQTHSAHLSTAGYGLLHQRNRKLATGARLVSVAREPGIAGRRASTAGELLNALHDIGPTSSLLFKRSRTAAEVANELKALLTSECRTLQGETLGRKVFRFLQLNKSSALDLHQSDLDGSAGSVLGSAMAQLPQLRGLRLEDNPGFGDAGGVALAAGLSELGSGARLQWLSLANCGIGPEAAKALAVALGRPSMHGLEELHLQKNPSLGDAGGAALAAALAVLGPLQRLDLSGCELGPGTAGALRGALPRLKHLVWLNLQNNPGFGDEGGAEIAAGLVDLGRGAYLQKLELQNCSLGEKTAAVLQRALAQIPGLDWLRLHNNTGLGDAGCAAIGAGLVE